LFADLGLHLGAAELFDELHQEAVEDGLGPSDAAEALQSLGHSLVELQDLGQAELTYHRAAEAFAECGAPLDSARMLTLAADIDVRCGYHRRADELFCRALEALDGATDPGPDVSDLRRIIVTRRVLAKASAGDDSALEDLKQAAAKATDPAVGIAYAAAGARCLQLLGRFDDAAGAYLRTADLQRAAGHEDWAVESELLAAWLLAERADHPEAAWPIAREALQAARRLPEEPREALATHFAEFIATIPDPE
jgi:tetratricopeptide (TPR) repeat protein